MKPTYRPEAGRGDHPYAQGFYAAMDSYGDKKDYTNPYNQTTERESYMLWEDGTETFFSCCVPLDYGDHIC